MTFIETSDSRVKAAFERIIALRQLTAETGVKTYRSQSAILEGLEPQILAAVAILLTNKGNENDRTINSRAK
jgi:hypothetical protein